MDSRAAFLPMRAVRVLGVAVIVSGILIGVLTFVFLSYGMLTNDRVEMFWFWPGPVIGSFVSILGAILTVFPRRGTRRAIR